MQVDQFVKEYFTTPGRSLKDACDLLAFHASQATGAKIKISCSTVVGVPQLTFADIRTLEGSFGGDGTKFTVRDAFFILRRRAPEQAEAIAVGRVLSKLYPRWSRGAKSVYSIIPRDRRTLLDAGVSEA